jgi:predicted metalloprotease
MRLEVERESENVEDRRGEGFGGGVRPGHIGIGTIAVTITAFLIGLTPYPFGWIVLTAVLLLRLIHLWQKDRQK